MALTPQEIKIVQFGQKQGKSQDQILSALSSFRASNPQPSTTAPSSTTPQTQTQPASDPWSNIKQVATAGKNYIQNLVGDFGKDKDQFVQNTKDTANKLQTVDAQNPQGGVDDFKTMLKKTGILLENGVRQASTGINTVFQPVSTGISQFVKYVADKESDSKNLQDFTTDGAGGKALDMADAIKKHWDDFSAEHPDAAKNIGSSINVISALVGEKPIDDLGTAGKNAVKDSANAIVDTAGGAKNAIVDTTNAIKTGVEDAAGGATKALRTATGEVIPTADQMVNHNITRALDLTQGDLRNINSSTGNEVGRFIADKNLIGKNKADTISKLENFYKENYATVRTEVNKVPTVYSPIEVPGYQDALNVIKQKIDGVPGLEKSNAEVSALLKNENPKLSDVQRVKELIDKHFSLYKMTGDVGEGVQKEGLANIRSELRGFIEKQVKDNTGADISEMNNNVQTSQSIIRASKARATRGLTRANLSLSDLGLFSGGTVAGGPLVGAALVFAKKISQSSTFRLRVSGWLDSLSDASKSSVVKDLESGVVPKEISNIEHNTTGIATDLSDYAKKPIGPSSTKKGGFVKIGGKQIKTFSDFDPEDQAILTKFAQKVQNGDKVSLGDTQRVRDMFDSYGFRMPDNAKKMADIITNASDSASAKDLDVEMGRNMKKKFSAVK